MNQQRPNVLAFCVDEMRADHFAAAGNPVVQTPNLDRLAARGTRFSRAYCNNPICMPARASMFTGLLPRDHGVRVNGQALRRDLPTLPGILAANGYRTHAAGKLHLTPWVPKEQPPRPDLFPESLDSWGRGLIPAFPVPYFGFQSVDFVGGHVSYAYGNYLAWLRERGGEAAMLKPARARETPTGAPQCWKLGLPAELHYNRYIADSTIRLIQDSAKGGAAPFFAWCSFPDPHLPFAAPAPYCDQYRPEDLPLPSRRSGEVDDLPPVYRRVLDGTLRPNGCNSAGIPDAHWQEMLAQTYGMITHLDAEIGRVLDALDASGLSSNTIVVFVADHGDMMGDHGLFCKAFYTFHGCTRIPFLVAVPGGSGGQACDALVSQIDLLPSILDLCSIAMPGADWNHTATPFERGSVMPLASFPGRSWRGLLDGSCSAIRRHVVIENDDPTTGYQVRCLITPQHRLAVYPGTDDGELFDLLADPHELHNLWYRPDQAGLRARLIAELLDGYSRETPLFPIPPWNS